MKCTLLSSTTVSRVRCGLSTNDHTPVLYGKGDTRDRWSGGSIYVDTISQACFAYQYMPGWPLNGTQTVSSSNCQWGRSTKKGSRNNTAMFDSTTNKYHEIHTTMLVWLARQRTAVRRNMHWSPLSAVPPPPALLATFNKPIVSLM